MSFSMDISPVRNCRSRCRASLCIWRDNGLSPVYRTQQLYIRQGGPGRPRCTRELRREIGGDGAPQNRKWEGTRDAGRHVGFVHTECPAWRGQAAWQRRAPVGEKMPTRERGQSTYLYLQARPGSLLRNRCRNRLESELAWKRSKSDLEPNQAVRTERGSISSAACAHRLPKSLEPVPLPTEAWHA